MDSGENQERALEVLAKEPRFRDDMDVDIVRNYLRRVAFFQSFQPSDLQTMAYSVIYHKHPAGDIVFRQGEEGSDWFVILSGSVSIQVSTPEVPEGEVICVVLAGQGFGKESKEGEISKRSATVKAREDCGLLLIDSVVMSSRKPVMKRFGSKVLIDGMEGDEITEAEAAAFDPDNLPVSPKLKIRETESSPPAKHAPHKEKGHKEKEHKEHKEKEHKEKEHKEKEHPKEEKEKEGEGEEEEDEEEEEEEEEEEDHEDEAGDIMPEPSTPTSKHSAKSKGVQFQEEIPPEFLGIDPEEIEAMEQQVKEVLSEDLKHLKAFSHLSTSMREELANVIHFQFFEKAGEYVFKQGDIGTSWYVIYRGSVDVIVSGVAVATLGEGDGFGELALIAEKPRAASIITKEDGCQFIVVDKVDYLKIQEQISSNTLKLEEHGKVVLILEKREKKSNAPPVETPATPVAASGSGNNSPTASPNTSAVALPVTDEKKGTFIAVLAGTVDRLIQRLTEDVDEQFLSDFLLSFRQLLSTEEFWAKLMKRFQEAANPNISSLVVYTIDKWVRGHSNDFRQDPDLLDELLKFYLKMKTENREYYDKIQSAIIYQRLDPSVKGKSSSFSSTISRSWAGGEQKKQRRASAVTELWRKSIGKISRRKSNDFKDTSEEDPRQVFKALIPATQWIKVYRFNEDYKTLSVSPTTSALEIITLALEKFRMTETADQFILCEVRLNDSVREFKDDEISIISQMSKNGRLYLKQKEAAEVLPTPPIPERPEKIQYMVLEISADEIARVMTLLDYELFSRIDPLEFYYSIFKTKNKNISNLNTFVNRFNEINMWVITEICSKDNLHKRFYTIKKFIDVASLLVYLKNYNSAFAILSGLGNVAVTRMTQTWKKLNIAGVQEFERLQQLMDPSRNMRKYRSTLLATQPPLIPFFPILMKDLFFINDCNQTYTPDGLVNFEKFRMINDVVRVVDGYRKVPYDHILQPYSVSPGNRMEKKRKSIVPESFLENQHSSQEISEYLSQLYVIDDVKHLTKMSHEVEPKEQK